MRKRPQKIEQGDEALLEKLRRHPELRERIEKILALADSPEHQSKTANEIEEILIEEVRRLGAETMRDWAQGVEKAIGAEMQQRKPSTYSGKKNE